MVIFPCMLRFSGILALRAVQRNILWFTFRHLCRRSGATTKQRWSAISLACKVYEAFLDVCSDGECYWKGLCRGWGFFQKL